ncbi:leucine--tRNA ligase [Chloroflexota bacterium]
MDIGNVYSPKKFEQYWQKTWENAGLHRAREDSNRPKLYCLDYFPYPSGEGLHVGHCRNYVPTDVISRYMRMRGYNVLHPMGWDAFGEPAEQNAIKNNVTPRKVTDQNTANYKRQMRQIGTSYDWDREIDSSHPEYYRWTQWMFLLMYQKGLAYKDTNWQWWCPTCSTTLSSHEIEGDLCWRGHKGVTKKEIPAWYFKITAYADELISGLNTIDWPEPIRRMQRNWIGRSEGVTIQFQVDCDQNTYDEYGLPKYQEELLVSAFTTRPDTVFGVTFLVLAPEHPMVARLTTEDNRVEVDAYIEQSIGKSEIERISSERQNTGIFTGGYIINPLNGERVPAFISDYVVGSYGTGAVMGVPAHDQRDFEFAKKFGLEIRPVISPIEDDHSAFLDQAYVGPGFMVNSGPFDRLLNEDAIERIGDYLEESGLGYRTVNYRMRDWLISRQRYWGTPIPIIYCKACGVVPVPKNDLPVLLPDVDDFAPDGSGHSPLGRIPEFFKTSCPHCGAPAQRETDTMGGFACSSWYFLRFTSPNYHEGPFDPKAMEYWMPVDLYVGGAEHAVLHLLYARFWTKVLADEGLIPFREPFSRLINQGQLHGPDGQRMSKSRGNVVIPDKIIADYGADALRLYGLFMAPFEQNVTWNTDGISGAHRFLNRVWSLVITHWLPTCKGVDLGLEKELNSTIKIVSERIMTFRFNTMVSALMEFVNLLYERVDSVEWKTRTFQNSIEIIILLLAPVVPYIAEELWIATGHEFSVHQQIWPEYCEELARNEMVEIPIQVDGKTRGKILVDSKISQDEALNSALETPNVQKFLEEREITRVVYVPGKILNVVTT